MSDKQDQVNRVMADWWAQWLPSEKRQAFVDAVLGGLSLDGEAMLHNDYDPDDILLEAIREAGIPCRGYMFSGTDLGLPAKTYTRRSESGRITLKWGYAAREEPLSRENHWQWLKGKT